MALGSLSSYHGRAIAQTDEKRGRTKYNIVQK